MAKKRVSLESIDRKIDRLIRQQESLQRTDVKLLRQEGEELSGLEKLQAIQRELARSVEPHPLRRLTLRDIAQGTVGAFFGVLAHFTFFYGVKVAEQISIARAVLLIPLSLVIGAIFLYSTGFRKVPRKYLWYLPIRLFALQVVAVVMAVIVLAIFQPSFAQDAGESFKQVATVSLIGLLGAITADLIGKE